MMQAHSSLGTPLHRPSQIEHRSAKCSDESLLHRVLVTEFAFRRIAGV